MNNYELIGHYVSKYVPETVYTCTTQTIGKPKKERSKRAVTITVPLTNPVVRDEQRRRHSNISSSCG